MGMSRCYSLMKCLLILFNIILLVLGAAACGAAGWALWDGRASETPQGRAGLCALAGWGAVLALGALAALAGAVRHSASLLAASFALLALAGVAEGAAAWWGAAHLPQLRRALAAGLAHAVRHDYGRLPARTQILDAIQQGLECCGAESTRDWQSSAWASSLPSPPPPPADGAPAAPAPATAARMRTLDLSLGAPTAYYTVPESCCEWPGTAACDTARVVPAASGGAAGLHAAACGPRVLAALARAARGPLGAAAGLLALHAAALLLALALCLRARPAPSYKA